MKKKRANKTAFDLWWEDPNRPNIMDISPYESAKIAFNAGRKSMPSNPKLRKALSGLLEMLEDWNAGFDGFYEVTQAEKAIGRKFSNSE